MIGTACAILYGLVALICTRSAIERAGAAYAKQESWVMTINTKTLDVGAVFFYVVLVTVGWPIWLLSIGVQKTYERGRLRATEEIFNLREIAALEAEGKHEADVAQRDGSSSTPGG